MSANRQLPEPTLDDISAITSVVLPRVTIEFCVQCKWNLRAAYYCQELLQTFSRALGEVALIPSTSGTFVVSLWLQEAVTTARAKPGTVTREGETRAPEQPESADRSHYKEALGPIRKYLLWDRKTDGGFPETKELKRRVRDLVEPGKGLGHVDVDYPKKESIGTRDGQVETLLSVRQEQNGQEDDQGGEAFPGASEEAGKGDRCKDCTQD